MAFGENNGEIVVRTAKLMLKTVMIQVFWRILAGLSIVHNFFWEGLFACCLSHGFDAYLLCLLVAHSTFVSLSLTAMFLHFLFLCLRFEPSIARHLFISGHVTVDLLPFCMRESGLKHL